MRRMHVSIVGTSLLLVTAIGTWPGCDSGASDVSPEGEGPEATLPAAREAALGVDVIRFCNALSVSESSVTSSMTTFLLAEDPANEMASTSSVCDDDYDDGGSSETGGYVFTNLDRGSTVEGYIADAEADLADGTDVYLRIKTTGNAWRKADASSKFSGTFLVSDGLGPICIGVVSGASGAANVIVTEKRELYIALPHDTDLDNLRVTFSPKASTTCIGSGVGDQAYANLAMSTPKIWFP